MVIGEIRGVGKADEAEKNGDERKDPPHAACCLDISSHLFAGAELPEFAVLAAAGAAD